MDVERGFLSAIEADPADETSWLVLADWLDDRGKAEQAELTRLTVALRRPTRGPDRPAQEERLRELVAAGACVPLPRLRLPLGQGLRLELLLVPPGTFLMGSPDDEPRRDGDEGPVHAVTLTRGFWMGVYPLTQGQWQAIVGGHPPGRFRGRHRPVDRVSWEDAQVLLRALAARLPGRFRLPSEAEWEYACRAGTTTPFAFGQALSSHEANFDGNYPYGDAPGGPWLEQTSPVGSYPANAFGLFDMHGNVWEWCSDWYDEDYYAHSPGRDPPGPAAGSLRVLRGGSWYSYSWSCRSAGRERFAPESGAGNYGLRVVMEAGR